MNSKTTKLDVNDSMAVNMTKKGGRGRSDVDDTMLESRRGQRLYAKLEDACAIANFVMAGKSTVAEIRDAAIEGGDIAMTIGVESGRADATGLTSRRLASASRFGLVSRSGGRADPTYAITGLGAACLSTKAKDIAAKMAALRTAFLNAADCAQAS